jgi:hypothetical protein
MFSDELTVSVLAPSLPHQSPSAALSISALSNTSYVSNSPADLSISNLNLGVKIATQQAMQSSAAVFVQSLPSHVVPLPIAPWLSHAGIPSNLINNAAQPSSATQDADDMALSQALAALHDHDMSMFASDTSSTLIRSAAEAIVHAASHGPSRSPSQSPLLTVASLTSLASSDTLHSIPSLSSLAHSPSPLDELEVEAAAASMRRRARHLAQSIIQQESGHDAARTEMTTASLDDDQDELAELHWNQVLLMVDSNVCFGILN